MTLLFLRKIMIVYLICLLLVLNELNNESMNEINLKKNIFEKIEMTYHF